jgi:hypothetical protein
MKIQLANKTYHTVNEGCCLDCAFWDLKQLGMWELKGGCQFGFECLKPLKKQLFNDKIFKL